MSILKLMWFRKERIYADAAAATPISARAKRELVRLLDFYGNAGALHKEAVQAKDELEKARETVAKAIGAHADEIIFTSSGTEGNNTAIQGVLRPLLRSSSSKDMGGKKVHAITSAIEHSSVLEPLRALTREGLELTELPVDSGGLVSVEDLTEAITDDTVFVSVQLVNSEIGSIEPVREIAKAIRRSGKKIYFHTDASQAPLWMDIKVEKLGVDLLTLDAQKILGPKGVGALYIKRGAAIEPLLLGSKQERGLRGGTENVPLVGSFAVALEDAAEGVSTRAGKTAEVRDYLWEEIKKRIPTAVVNGPQLSQEPKQEVLEQKSGRAEGEETRGLLREKLVAQATRTSHRVANNLNISIPGLDREMAVLGLDAEGIAITTRSACNVADSELSYVIKALNGPECAAKGAIRITLLPDATKPQARRIAEALAEIAKRYTSDI